MDLTESVPAGASVLVTGAPGFVGSRLACHLAARGFDVHAIVRPASRLEQLSSCADQIRVHVHDGTMNGLVGIVRAATPRVVFHAAARVIAEHQPDEVGPLMQSNLAFGAQLLEAMSAVNVPFMVNTGTAWQHFNNSNYDPTTLYAATKQAFEDIIQYYVSVKPLRVATIKLYDLYGPADPRPKLLTLVERAARTGDELDLTKGEQLIDMVYIDDVLDAYVAAWSFLESSGSERHAIFALSSGASVTIRELVATYASILARPIHVNWGAKPYRSREIMRPWTGGRPLPGWSPRVSLRDGLSRCAAAIVSAGQGS
ncbi:MAG: NAD(P)-dependent oxidoreductase [Gemmatimonadetes bacterium]|nr:NAD(P)-dependent oxidoreductase [Gemmatimonadota bacterium]